jgi:hypothetical protein
VAPPAAPTPADGRHLTPTGHAYAGLRLASDLPRLGLASR